MSFVKSADVIKNLKSYLNSRADKVPMCFCCALWHVGQGTCFSGLAEHREAQASA